MVKDKSGGGDQTAVELYPIYDGVQPNVLHRAVLACRISKSLEVRTSIWNVSSMVRRFNKVVEPLHRRNIDFCCAHVTRWKCEDASCYW